MIHNVFQDTRNVIKVCIKINEFRFPSSWFLPREILDMLSDVSEEPTAFIFRVEMNPKQWIIPPAFQLEY